MSDCGIAQVHMSIHDGLKHQCSICGHTSKSRDALRKHLAYRHLIGMSGPVRPRMPANKRRKHDGTDDMLDTSMQSTENENQIAAASSLSFSDPDNDHLAHSGGEDVDQNGNPSVANDTWWDKTFLFLFKRNQATYLLRSLRIIKKNLHLRFRPDGRFVVSFPCH